MSESGPLAGKTVLVTRSQTQAPELCRLLADAGARVLVFPMIEIVPPESWDSMDDAIANLDRYDWIVFTSANGVRSFFDRLFAREGDSRSLAKSKVAAVGSATAHELGSFGVVADLVPEHFVSDAILPHLGDDLTGIRVALVRAEKGRDDLMDGIRARGGSVDLVVAYRSRPVEDRREELESLLVEGNVDGVTFTSSSTVENLFGQLSAGAKRSLIENTMACSIGPVTSKTARDLGITNLVEAPESTIESLVSTVVEHLEHR